MRQLDQNVVKLYANETKRFHQLGDLDVVKLRERKALRNSAKGTVMWLIYDQL